MKSSLSLFTLALCLLLVSSSGLFAEKKKADASKSGSGKEVLLVDLMPSETEWGTDKHDLFPDMAFGPRTTDWLGGWARNPTYADEKKIVKTIDPTFTVPEGKSYESDMPDIFAVAGEFKTGVGLLSRRMTMYYWTEYEIPKGAKRFQAEVFCTDDVGARWGSTNQQFVMKVMLDEKGVYENGKTRVSLETGSGELFDSLDIEIPAGTKKIRFFVQNSAWGDGNGNTELVINNGRFLMTP